MAVYTEISENELSTFLDKYNIEEIIKFFLVLGRFLQYKWVRNLTVE